MQPIFAQQLLRGLWHSAPAGLMITSVVTDNREARPGSVFVAIQGERVDGHAFAADALQRGAEVVVGSHAIAGVSPEKTVIVPDVLDAIITMGANYRRLFQPLVLGITGSVGKTTTKEFAKAVFSAFDNTLATQGNQNNEIGLPKTLFKLDESVRYAVLEMGMQGLGEIRKLTRAASPNAAIITKIGTAHLQALGSIENILQAKLEICEGLPLGAPVILNGDDALLRKATNLSGARPVYVSLHDATCDVWVQVVRQVGQGQYFTIQDSQFGSIEAYIPTLGNHTLHDALLAYTAATRLGLNAAQSAAALAQYTTVDMRQNIVQTNGVTVIEDCYNANPDSMLAALQTLAALPVQGKRIALLADMLELGPISLEAHEALGCQCAEYGVNILLTVGEQTAFTQQAAAKLGLAGRHCASNREAAEYLQKNAQPGDALLVKGSRGMHLEEVLQQFGQG